MKRATATALGILGLSLAVTLAGCAGGSGGDDGKSAQDLPKITIASMAGITTNNAVQAGIDRGDFKDAGLDAKLIEVENPPAALAALQGGSADFAYSPISTALTALSKGIDIKMVAASDGFPDDGKDAADFDDTAIYVNPSDGVTGAEQLAGKKVAVPSRNGMMEITIAGTIADAGGDPQKIEWLALDQQSQLTALKQARINGAGLATPFTQKADQEGMTFLVKPKVAFFEHGASGVWITTGAIAKEKPELVAAFQKANKKVNEWANAHLSEIAAEVIEQQKLDISPEDMIVGYFPPALHAEDVARANKKMAALGYLDKPLDLDGVVIEAD